MKIRTGFVSNSSSSSFVVQTKKDEIDNFTKNNFKEIPEKEIELLKKCGFVPINNKNPFHLNISSRFEEETNDDTYLGYFIICNEDFIMQFLVAHNISFKASTHYDDYLYSYNSDDKYIYVLYNYGMAHWQDPKECFRAEEQDWIEIKPYEKISKKEFMKGYDEKASLLIMGIDNEN